MKEQSGQHEEGPQPLYVSLILDESGSMQSCKHAAIAGFNQYVKSLQDEPAPTWFTLTLFNARRTEVRYRGVPVGTVPELDVETYRPQDTTRRSSRENRSTRSSKTASGKAGASSISAPITTCGPRAKIWAWHKTAALPFQRAP